MYTNNPIDELSENSEEDQAVTASEVYRVRRATGYPVISCKRILKQIPPAKRLAFIEEAEATSRLPWLHDPIEDDPEKYALLLPIFEEATREAREEHRVWVAEFQKISPEGEEPFDSEIGLCHAIWRRVKEIMLERHEIEWRSPREMNPWLLID